ncbi:MAG: hypothetical protein NTW58_09730, partial [Actinobacteria bacterium]|nr:hypothetical protein [Actinomycetota bacterium]
MDSEPAGGALNGPHGVTVPVKLLTSGARLPARAYEHDAAYDLHAAEALDIEPLGRAVVSTGVALGLPPGLAALTLPRSGLAARHGISLVGFVVMEHRGVETVALVAPGFRDGQPGGEDHAVRRVLLVDVAGDA